MNLDGLGDWQRTTKCGVLSAQDIGKEHILMGWVNTRRDHGGVIFCDLRDHTGISQIVFGPQHNKEAFDRADHVRSEYVLAVKGVIARRDQETINPKMVTGEIEMHVDELHVLNTCGPLPFQITDNQKELTEKTRLRFRTLDLRRAEMQKILMLRSKASQVVRNFFYDNDFFELETPFLTKSTPEGARDFLVPSRVNPGSFYALPQSPQLFKQILMISGYDRYFQIVKCFRDEDLRGNRQPEFTQIDIELSFTSQDEILHLVEQMITKLFKETIDYKIPLPIPRMTYQEAMKRYKSDKPDLRERKEGFGFLWILNFPLFKYAEDRKQWDMEHHPFTSPIKEDIDLIETSPGNVRSRAYDLVVNGTEIASGSIRIHRRDLQEKIFKRIGLDMSHARERFGFLLEAFDYGAPPHGGIAVGLDRLIALMCEEDSIREVIAFPKTQKASCPMTEAPSSVDENQLKELGIKSASRRS